MGLAQIPWLLAKGTTGFYSGVLLGRFCPENTPQADLHTGQLWLIYACIGILTPIGLWLARGWVRPGLHISSAPENRASGKLEAAASSPSPDVV